RGSEAGLVQVAPPSEPAGASHLGAVRRAAQALSPPASPHHGPNLGDVATSHLSGRAGWWKSPCPVLARAPGPVSAWGYSTSWIFELERGVSDARLSDNSGGRDHRVLDERAKSCRSGRRARRERLLEMNGYDHDGYDHEPGSSYRASRAIETSRLWF